MSRLLPRPVVCLLVASCAALLSGCGSSVAVVPVSGKVTVGSQPVAAGQVSCFSTSSQEEVKEMMTGTIDSSGEYTMRTGRRSGAPVGKYKVTVTPPMMPSPDGKPPATPFNAKYMGSQTTPLTI